MIRWERPQHPLERHIGTDLGPLITAVHYGRKVARLIGRYLYAHGILPRDIFVERNALALKGQYVGQTAPTVTDAMGRGHAKGKAICLTWPIAGCP